MTAIVTQEEDVIIFFFFLKKKKCDSGHFKRNFIRETTKKFNKGDNSGNETHKIRKFRKFYQQTGVGISLEPKTE
jgi:hypothetical protein